MVSKGIVFIPTLSEISESVQNMKWTLAYTYRQSNEIII
jgi:hypothetical protein